LQLVAGLLSLLLGGTVAGSAQAISFSPGGLFAPDDGTELFLPRFHPEPSCHCALINEVGDAATGLTHEWGIYFADDPATLIPILDQTDDTGPQQVGVDFDSGIIYDRDSGGVVETLFAPSLDAFGFYLFIDYPDPTADLLAYSEPGLNAGSLDLAGTFPTLDNDSIYLIAFEVDQQVLALELVDSVTPVPEPTTALLFASGLLLAGASRRRDR